MTSPTASRGSRKSAALFFITLGLFGLYLIEFGVVGILPTIMNRFDITILESSWLLGSFALIVAVCGPFLVLIVGRFDRRLLLALSLLVFGLVSVASAFAPSFAVLLAIRIPGALLHAVFFSVAFTTVRALFPPEKAARATAIAFVGTTMGMVLGVPLTAWVAATLSYESAFHLAGIANILAALGVWLVVPRSESRQRASLGDTVSVLKKPALWLALVQAVAVFGAMLSVYGFAAEYLGSVSGLDGQRISIILVIFGLGGIIGNLAAGKFLDHWLLSTALLYPVALSAAYLVLHLFGSSSFAALFPVALIWGIGHAAGQVVSQVWTVSSAPGAPEFVTSLFASAGNFGVLAGSTIGATFITAAGMQGAIYSGWMFAALALVLVLISRLRPFRDSTQDRISEQSKVTA
ncbi:MFS transporter [Glutamicibacter sp.]|jgi:Arabinose efflux permease|uniref:MFS transporter n=1 Tax=Glutamicibacter sp. TaxID=1931995 RepID=UPI002B46D0AA|nr:MFS transporter [Glutamicibacter sp.]HJX79997.1 MFS transporter [Glutamicibacter sp.]